MASLEQRINIEVNKTVTRLLRVQLSRERVARWLAERNYASAQLERAKLQLLLDERANRTREDQMPLYADAAKRWFDEQR